jgi:DNA-binding beta-propeller fold protein YncE
VKTRLSTLTMPLIAAAIAGLPLGIASAQQAAPATDSAALTLKTRIPLADVFGRMDHMGIDVKGQRLFAAAFDHHTLEVIDLQAGRQVHTIANLIQPQGAFYDPSTNRLFVSSSGDGSVKIFDGSTFELLQTVKLSADADNVRYDARGKRVIVGYGGEKSLNGQVARAQGQKDGALALIEPATGEKTAEIATDAHPESFQLEKSGTRVFINVPDKKEIVVADLVSKSVLAHWPLTATTCTDNFPMTLDETHHRLFVACRAPASLLVLDTESGKPVASVPFDPVVSSDDIFYDGSKGRIYVLGRIVQRDNPRGPGPGVINVIQQKDPDHYERTASYPTGWGAQTGYFEPESGKLFVATRRQQGGQGAEILVYETK